MIHKSYAITCFWTNAGLLPEVIKVALFFLRKPEVAFGNNFDCSFNDDAFNDSL